MSGNISGRLDRATASRSFTKRAPLGVRIMLAAFAVLAIAFAVLAGVNIDAQRQYDAATQTLTENLETASRNDADLKQLLTSQQELDARFASITGKSAVLLPQISESTTYNAQVSKQLTDLVQQQVDADAVGAARRAAQITRLAHRGTAQASGGVATQQRGAGQIRGFHERIEWRPRREGKRQPLSPVECETVVSHDGEWLCSVALWIVSGVNAFTPFTDHNRRFSWIHGRLRCAMES